MNNGNNGNGRIEFLQKRLEENRAALAAEMEKRAKREKRETEKLQSVIGGAVLKAAGLSPEVRLKICEAALCNVTDDKARRFLADKGWL